MVVIWGELVLDFIVEFLRVFVIQMKQVFMFLVNDYKFFMFLDGFMVCVGIFYIKVKYFFYYGVNLVESFCKQVKVYVKVINLEWVFLGLVFY